MSNYNYGLEPGVEGQGTSKLRFILIFVAISALTAALLWWFWPDKGEVVPGKGEPDTKVPETPAVVVPGDGKTGNGEKKPAPEPSVGVGGRVSAAPADKEKTPEFPAAPVPEKEPAKQPGGVDPTDPVLPDKGIITPADRKGADLPVVPVDNVVSEAQKSSLARALALLNNKEFAKAETLAVKALEGAAENGAFYREGWRVLTAARMGMVFQGKTNPYVVRYRIRGGDSLSGVAGKFFTTVELLRKRNNISGSRIFVGRQLFIVPGDWKITVSKKYRLLKLFQKKEGSEKLFAVWEVGIGRMGKTPAAEFAISSRLRHPDWYLPDGRVFKYGDPENQLGDYFLKLAPASAPGRPLLGYGIHGAKDENTVGRSLSSGCVRMRNADVEALYYLVPVGTPVSVTEE